MSNDLHDIDDLFHSALEENKEMPSAGLKESLFAHLDKKDAESYKKRFIGWKRIALLLLLILAGLILYESGIVKTGTSHSTKEIVPLAKETKETGPNVTGKVASTEQIPVNEKTEAQKENPGNENNKATATELIQSGQQENKELNKDDLTINKNKENTDLHSQKNKHAVKQVTSLATGKKRQTISDRQQYDNANSNDENRTVENLAGEKRNIDPAIDKINIRPLISMQRPIATGLKMSAAIDSLLKNSIVKNINQERIHHFKPYWTLTGVMTYDRLNYKLDSDEPNAITSIKHREVHEPSFSIGILATRQMKEKWGLQTGLVYSNTAIGISPQKIYAFQDPAGDIAYKYVTSSGYAYVKPGFGAPPGFGDSITATEAKHSLHSVSVPAVIKYTIGRNKFLFIPGAGIEANFITRAKLEIEIEDVANRETVFINKLDGARSFYWSLVADAELRYIVNKKMAFSIRPMFRYAISPITENNIVETFPYSFGAGLGITYKF